MRGIKIAGQPGPLAERLVALRRQHGWTQERLAEEAGLTVRTVQRAEAGEVPSLTTLDLLAHALDAEARELTTGRDALTARAAHSEDAELALAQPRVLVALDDAWHVRAALRAWNGRGRAGTLEILDSVADLKGVLHAEAAPPPALLIVDLGSSEGDPAHLIQWIRLKESLACMPIVAVVPEGDRAALARAYAAGANAAWCSPQSFCALTDALAHTFDFWLWARPAGRQAGAPPPPGPHHRREGT